jgi:hypothetical protein
MHSKGRMQAWRSRKKEKGGRSLTVWLEPETAMELEALCKHFGRHSGRYKGEIKPLIAEAIKHLYESNIKN